jgi:hypothetical protein
MKNKTTIKIIFIISIFCIFVSIGTISSQTPTTGLEVQYPSFGGADSPQSSGYLLSSYIRYIYNFAIICGGLIALLSLIYGGFRFLTSAGKPAAITDARGQILAGFLGLAVIFGSYIILNELNPDLVSLRMPFATSAGRRGIILYNLANCAELGNRASIPEITELDPGVFAKAMNTSGNPGLGQRQDVFPVSFYSFHNSRELTLEFFANPKCEGDSPVFTMTNLQKNQCQNLNVGSNIQCIKFLWHTSGIWVFNKLDNGGTPDPNDLPDGWQEGKDYLTFQSTQDHLPIGFDNRVQAIAIVPSEAEQLAINYGVIAHNISGPISMNNDKGWAHIYLPGSGSNGNCHPATTDPNVTLCGPFDGNSEGISSLTIFNVPKIGGLVSDITICRNDKCEPEIVEVSGAPEVRDAVITCYPNADCIPDSGIQFTDITDIFGTATTFSAGDGVVYGMNLNDGEWDTGNPIALGRNEADGVSAIEINQGASYLVLLYEDLDLDFGALNDNDTWIDAAIINVSMATLRDIQMDGRVGTIVIINTDPGENY